MVMMFSRRTYIMSFHTLIFSPRKLCRMRLVRNIAFMSKSGLTIRSVTVRFCGNTATWFFCSCTSRPLVLACTFPLVQMTTAFMATWAALNSANF